MIFRWLLIVTLGCTLARGAAEPETEVLPAMEVKAQLVCSFGFGVIATWDAKTQHVGRIFITEVISGSTAERLGLKRGDEIISLNGKKVPDLKGGNKPGSDLFALLVNRPAGESLEIEVTVRAIRKVTLPAAVLGAPAPLAPPGQTSAPTSR
jgi:C-terminal processing protease CtpA/Prc